MIVTPHVAFLMGKGFSRNSENTLSTTCFDSLNGHAGSIQGLYVCVCVCGGGRGGVLKIVKF